MNRIFRSLVCFTALGGSLLVHAQNTVFNDSFAGDSLSAAVYPAVTPTTTGWDVLSNKAAPAPVEAAGTLTINMAGTTSGFVETQALFAPAPVQLLPGTYIELTASFVPTNLLTTASDNLVLGLFNSGGSAPLPGLRSSGLSNALSTFATGGAKGWLGFNANIPLTGASPKMLNRAAQTAANNTVQDVLFASQSSSVGYSSPAAANFSLTGTPATIFTSGNNYTVDYKLSLSADGNTLTTLLRVFNGTGTTGTGGNTLVSSYSGTITGANLLTKAFDALAVGWRADAGGSNPSNLKLGVLTVATTGGAPWFVTQPPANTTVSLGGDLTLIAAVGGLVNTYQWQVSTDSGTTFSNLDAVANPSAVTSTLTITGVGNADAAVYRLVATNAAGSTTSTNATVTVTSAAVAPTIVSNPVGATILGGSPVTFNVTANGTAPLDYQWLKSTDGFTYSLITGATGASYTISPVGLPDEGLYEVTVSNVAGSATSVPVTLTVNQPLAINVQPVGATLNPGDPYTIGVTAVGRPDPAYQWYFNGTLIPGATAATYNIASASAANNGLYSVVVSNSTGDTVTSQGAGIAVLSPTLTATALAPAPGATTVMPDTRLTLTFNQPVAVGFAGKILIYDAANPTIPVDTIDLVAANALMKTLRAGSALSTQPLPVQNKTVGGLTNFNYYPITVAGNTATIYPRNNVLAYGKTYFVTIDPGVFLDGAGLSYAGIVTNTGWTFATKAVGPAGGATRLVVAADGTGDFYTVQGALDFIPAGNTTPRTIFIRQGTYFEQVYFTGKHSLTFLGEDRVQTVIVYPNNNTFNNVSGSYHRMVFQGDHVNNVAVVNLTVQNSTPHGGSQAESLLLNGTATSQAIVTNVNLVSFQDTLQINGQAYIADSHISGDVDYMWGNGPNFFNHCELTAVTSSGYFTQIRNSSTVHGNVYLNCTLDSAAGITGSYLARIDPNASGGFPFSEVVYLNCVMGNASGATSTTSINPVGWLLNNTPDQTAASAPNVHFWEYNSHDSDGTPLNVATRITASHQLVPPADAATIANYSTPAYVLGNGWTPQLAPLIAVQPAGQTVDPGTGFTLSVQAFGIPAVTYQWLRNGVPIPGATDASYNVGSSANDDAGVYTVQVSNGAGSATSTPVPLVVHGAPPVILLQPANTTGLLGTTATLNGWAVGDGPFTYQWSKDGSPLPGATRQSLRLTGLQPTDGGNYSVAITNAGGTTPSSAALLSLVAPVATLPPLPVIPAVFFDVTAYGAVGDSATDNTAAIQAALNAASAAGGGTVEFPPAAGAYLSGPITMSGNTDFQVDSGAILQELPFGTYPKSLTAPSHFLTIASGSTNVELSGGGIIEGDGAAWWAAFNANTISARPRMVQITKATNGLFTGITLQNSPNFHLAFSGANNNVTIFGVTISAPGDSPNTDGMDVAGSNFLIQGCNVADGDDNIVAKPGSVFCQNLIIANCAFGVGHGVSVGGQTNVGLDGMAVMNCTFNGTDTGLRLKADSTQGGPVQNLSFTNITMTNVTYPILFYSYYNQIGSPGAKSGSSQTTTAKVSAWNSSPPNSLGTTTVPTWQNITISHLTATGASGYSMIWGLPLANGLIANVTLNNVNISGGAGFELFDATNVQFTGSNSVGPFVTFNSLGITSQPVSQAVNAGDPVTFSVATVGASGVTSTAHSYRWKLNGVPLFDGPQGDGSTVGGAATATLALTNARATSAGNYTVTVSNNLDGYNVATSSLVAGSLPVAATSAAATLTVSPVPVTVSLSNLLQDYDGTPKAPDVSTSIPGVAVHLTYDGSATAPTNAGTYLVAAMVSDPNYSGSTTASLTIAPLSAGVTVGSATNHVVRLAYDGTPKTPGVTTTPASLPVSFTYNGSSMTPTLPGTYDVAATVSDPNYAGAATGTLVISTTALVRHAPTISGSVDGSVQMLLGENVTLAGQAAISSDLLVPGTPTVTVNTVPGCAGTVDGPGAVLPNNYTITINPSGVMRYLVRRVDPLTMPVVTAPPLPTGTRNVALSNPTQSAGDFSTLRNLTLSGTAGLVAVPPGTYGTFVAYGNSGFVLGVPGSTDPVVYNLQSLGLNVLPGTARIQIVGPVIINLPVGILLNGTAGSAAHPDWLTLRIATGALTINGSYLVHANVIAPNGTVTLNAAAVLDGTVVSDRLNLNGTSILNDPGL